MPGPSKSGSGQGDADHREFLETDARRLHAKRLADTRGAWRGI